MNPNLKRIEATLNQLASQSASGPSASGSGTPSFTVGGPPSMGDAPASARDPFTVTVSATPVPETAPRSTENRGSAPSFTVAASRRSQAPAETVEPFPVDTQNAKAPSLPKVKPTSFSSHRHGANPALAMNLLHEMEAIVAGWQSQLQSTLDQIQALYLEGPIVDGWLESDAEGSQPLSQADLDRVRSYLNKVNLPPSQIPDTPQTTYRLCGLGEDGKLWTKHCPIEQLPSVSLAIARHQKLRQLLAQKQTLENRLNQLAETLVMLHSYIQGSADVQFKPSEAIAPQLFGREAQPNRN